MLLSDTANPLLLFCFCFVLFHDEDCNKDFDPFFPDPMKFKRCIAIKLKNIFMLKTKSFKDIDRSAVKIKVFLQKVCIKVLKDLEKTHNGVAVL